ncbi:MAG: RNA polymerase sigma factor [Chloroflexi bacterium]|nr:MAG: RNA polymerase sigma factor [Chloroflexota bacterium]
MDAYVSTLKMPVVLEHAGYPAKPSGIDLDTFNKLVVKYQDAIYRQAFYILGEPRAAEDIAQDTFLAAYRGMSSFRGGSFKSWLLRIATNLCLDELRRDKRHPIIPLEPVNNDGDENESPSWMMDSGEMPEEAAERKEFWENVQVCLSRLQPKLRTAVTLVDLQGLDYAEAASVLRISTGTLKSRLSRGRLKMKDVWIRKEAG